MKGIMYFISVLIILNITPSFADQADPNDYFKNRSWTLKNSKNLMVNIDSKYLGEPIQKPNQLNVSIQCSKSNVKTVVKNYGYCGLDSVNVIGHQLVIQFVDYDSRDPMGYCKIKRQKKFIVPNCP